MSIVPNAAQAGRPVRAVDPYAQRVREELRRVYIQQGTRTPLLGLGSIFFLAWVFHPAIPPKWLAAWASVALVLVVLRWGLCVLYSRTAEASREDLLRRMHRIAGLRIAAGACFGVVGPLWFPALSSYQELIFMVVSLGWYATTLLVSLASPIAALGFGIALLGPMSLAWIVSASPGGLTVGITTLALLVLLRQATDNAHAVVRAAIRSHLREQELARGLEQQRQDLEAAMRAKSQFLAAASHDLRQPVTSMNLLMSALAASRDEAAVRTVAAKFEAPLNALEQILSTLLEVSRLEAGIVEVNSRNCELREILTPVLAEYVPRAAAKGIGLDSSLPDFQLRTDPDLVQRILRNLLDNAIKFTESGNVSVQARRELPDTLVLAVADTGVGISWADQRRVFDDYFQTDNPHRDRGHGLGLGLAIVQRLVTLLGGRVTLYSQPRRGSRFEIWLPGVVLASGVVRAPTGEPARAGPSLAVSRVLVVEDDHLVVDAMAALFNAIGVEARFALDADDAMRQTALGRFMPDLALVDFGLPGRRDGIALVQSLRLRLPGCVFLLVTGDTRPEVIRRATDAGIPILHKPITIEQLSDKLSSLQRRR